MSYDVRLVGAGGETVTVDYFEGEGGTFALGGSDKAELNITYNYSQVYRLFDFSINDLDGKVAEEFLPLMTEIVGKCGTKQFDDYWAPTPGNAGHALNILLQWGTQHPDAHWEVC